jgi:hypothetical protein
MKAFPSGHDPKTGTMQHGMDLRDYFAGQAIVGLIAIYGDDRSTIRDQAVAAYAIADELLLAREGL